MPFSGISRSFGVTGRNIMQNEWINYFLLILESARGRSHVCMDRMEWIGGTHGHAWTIAI